MTFTPCATEWINKTNAIGLYVKRGKYGGTYAHNDLAFEFASAISPVFKLHLIKEFQRLKEEENNSRQIEWNAKHFLGKNAVLSHFCDKRTAFFAAQEKEAVFALFFLLFRIE